MKISRHGGSRGILAVEYEVTVASTKEAIERRGFSTNLPLASSNKDVDVEKGVVYFVSGETSQTFVVKVRMAI